MTALNLVFKFGALFQAILLFMLRGRGLELRSASSCALAISSCLQAALAEHSDGSERSEAKQKSSLPPFNPPAPYDAFKVATLLC